MPTFLTNRKMNRALAARVEASVRGRPHRRDSSAARRIVSLARLALVLCVFFSIYTVLTLRRSEQREPEPSSTRPGGAQTKSARPADGGTAVTR
ncbi:MAG TPA: hypothetical protein VM925_01370 [Labilithrix sp.]|nr:hypothetical protein [Labilithrix sp.]